MKHRILLLGMGFWGSHWLNIIQHTSRCELVGLAGSEAELKMACNNFGIDPAIAFTDYREAIAKTDAEIAVIVLPGVLHLDADRLALEKGDEYYHRKTPCYESAGGRRIVKAQREASQSKIYGFTELSLASA